MCNTRSNIYLQFMKTYPMSVNTLMWHLTSERHDNCAPCLGLILPIRWVTPPPNFLEDFLLASWLHYLRIWFVFNIDFTSKFFFSKLIWSFLIYQYICVMSSIAFTYSYVFKLAFFWTKWMWTDPNPFCASSSNSIYLVICVLLERVKCLH